MKVVRSVLRAIRSYVRRLVKEIMHLRVAYFVGRHRPNVTLTCRDMGVRVLVRSYRLENIFSLIDFND